MPWRECNVMDERAKFVARLLEGEFMLADRLYCYPLTITDQASRYLFAVEALDSTKEINAFTVFERVFKENGLPAAIRTDNGVPFASPNAPFSLSKLLVWWLRLGIGIERIKTRKINLSQVFAGQKVGIKQVEDRLWLVSFMDYDLGYFGDTERRLEPIDNPFGAKLSPMSSQ
jgi:hypothetical protein